MARRTSRVSTDDSDVELDMTPMLDVVFILLIFFIVTSVFIKEPGTDVIRPEALTQDDLNPSMLVAVTSESEIWVNRRSYEMAEMRPVIEQLLQENPRARATIQGDEEAEIGVVLDVQELLLEMGVDVTISTLQD
ncbi:MAG: biopolymer transporter ExbD [Maricaulis sp.]|jgi:biopolymer transport protein ExbD|uniref:ExbD/TolR family protein n=1 Tax=Maricaulis sp. TaxID=1486257 RepID=UPI001B1C0E69|nr:biopolymer transporter ExbD [Maricaulis sp.]MBO6729121.1 biopolymer transporter ExbD [Maricaulis sp.]MBO6847537.1 biopolymer transporter ExbD [Maricaulis sp.]MBO6877107.1 biopolymer transporter ExbD [Maricaulis sp.]MDM7984785.1 biopolymer transporter ExbD [Maricaulis sp.]